MKIPELTDVHHAKDEARRSCAGPALTKSDPRTSSTAGTRVCVQDTPKENTSVVLSIHIGADAVAQEQVVVSGRGQR